MEGNVNGFDLFSLTPSEGPFRSSAYPAGRRADNLGKATFQMNLPRQFREGKGLKLKLTKKTDHIPEKEYDLSGILTGKRFDWSAANLDDISIALDYSGNIISVSVIDWQTGMESEIVI